MKRILAGLFMLVVIISCAEDKKEASSKETSLEFKTKTIEKSYKNCSPEEGECTFISLRFPVFIKEKKAATKINNKIEEYIANTIDYHDNIKLLNPEEVAEDFIRNYRETSVEFPEFELAWEATIIGKVIYSSPSVISIMFKADVFTGGAHGYRSTNYLNFDPNSGTILNAEDLFSSAFLGRAEKDFRIQHDIPLEENINSTGMFFENNEFHLPENIGITRENIILHYNAYEIAPYASGNYIITYPKKEIDSFLILERTEVTEQM